MDRSQINYIKYILEAHDNVAIMSTIDSKQAIVQLRIAPGCERLVSDMMNALSVEFTVRPIAGATLPNPASRHHSNGDGEGGSATSDQQRNFGLP